MAQSSDDKNDDEQEARVHLSNNTVFEFTSSIIVFRFDKDGVIKNTSCPSWIDQDYLDAISGELEAVSYETMMNIL